MEAEQTATSWLDRPVFAALPSINFEKLLAALIIILAILSRFIGLGDRVVSHDEVNHVVPSFSLFQGNGYRYDPVTHGPLQFHLIATSYFLFGDSDFSTRIPAASFSVATVAVALFMYRRYLGRLGALIAGFLFLISPFMMFYGRYARNEAFSGLWGVLTLYGVLRYLERGDKFSLLLLATVTALHFTDKATAFIYNAELLIFLTIVFLLGLTRMNWSSRNARNLFYAFMVITILLVGFALVFGVVIAAQNPVTVTNSPVQPTQPAAPKPATLLSIAQNAFIGLGFLSGLAGLIILVRGLGLKAIRKERTFDLLMLIGLLTLPQLAALPVKLLGWDPLDYTSTGMLRTSIFIILCFAGSIALGIWWNWRVYLTSMAIFYAIYIPLYTTFFTNGSGFFMGLVAALGYWMSQQAVQRGTQPLYYYILVQIPVYEYLSFLGTLMATYFGFRHHLFSQWTKFSPANQPLPEEQDPLLAESIEPIQSDLTPPFPDIGPEAELEPEPDLSVAQPAEETPAAIISDEGQESAYIEPGVVIPVKVPVLGLLVYWSLTSLVAFSLAGERMPWLTLHIAIGMLLSAGWGLAYLIEKTPWHELKERKAWIALLISPIFIASILGLSGNLLGTQPPFQGNTLDQLYSTANFAMGIVGLLGSGAAMTWLLKDWKLKNIFRLVVLTVFALMAVLTARAAYMASFINYDDATEYLVYAHAARGPKDILAQVEEISRRTTRGLDIAVAYDNEALYPFWWYFRDYPNKKYFADKPSRDLKDSPIIIAGDANWTKLDPIVKDNFVYFEYMRLWWPNEAYKDLTLKRVWDALINPEMRKALFEIWINRDYTLFGQLTNNSSVTLSNWSPSAKIRIYIRKDILAQMWNYGAAPTAPTVQVDPYQKNMITISPDLGFGTTGQQPGQFNAPRQVAVASDGTLYVADSRNNRIQHLSPDGKVLQAWGTFADLSKGEAPGGTLNEPWGVAVAPDSFVFVTDTWNHRVQKFTADGQFVKMWGYFGQAEKPDGFWGPRGIWVDQKGRVYVADTGNKRIAIFDEDGNFIAQAGSTAGGLEPGEFNENVAVTTDDQGYVYVTDTWNQRVQVLVWDSAGKNLSPYKTWDINGWNGQSLDNKPFIAVNKNGNVFVTDPEGPRVLEFSKDGAFLRGWSDFALNVTGFNLVSGIAADSEGRVWVVDAGDGRLLRFNPDSLSPQTIGPGPVEISPTPTSSGPLVSSPTGQPTLEVSPTIGITPTATK